MPGELRVEAIVLDIGVEAIRKGLQLRVVDARSGIEQGQCETLQAGDGGVQGRLFVGELEQGAPQRLQAGKVLDRIVLDARIIHEADEEHLRGTELLG